jgi:hypothetical protein
MATLMIIAADGQARCKSLLIFRGKGRSKAQKNEHKFYDKRVAVVWQDKAYRDTRIMVDFVNGQYGDKMHKQQKRQHQ